MQPVVAHGGEVMYFLSVCFKNGFLNCDDICSLSSSIYFARVTAMLVRGIKEVWLW